VPTHAALIFIIPLFLSHQIIEWHLSPSYREAILCQFAAFVE
jgi:hypothetical protein